MAVSPRSDESQSQRRVRALAEPTRISLIELLLDGPRTVSDLAQQLGVVPGRLYHHLDVLEESGLVQLRQIRPKRIYEAVPPIGLGLASQILDATDRLELIAAMFELARTNAEAAHQRGEPLHVTVHSVFATPRELAALSAEVATAIERWTHPRRGRGAQRARLIFGAIPLPN